MYVRLMHEYLFERVQINLLVCKLDRLFYRDKIFPHKSGTKLAFTLAEVLITITVIGIIAALTLPVLVAKIQKQEYVSQLKETYSIMNEGFRQSLAAEGVTSIADTSVYDDLNKSSSNTESDDIQFAYFQKYFKKIERIGYATQVANNVKTGTFTGETCKQWANSGFMMYYYLHDSNKCYGVRQENYKLINGAILNMSFFPSPLTPGAMYQYHADFSGPMKQVVGNVIIDVNGTKPPNTWGRDAFMFYLGQDGHLYAVGSDAYAKFLGHVYNVSSTTYRTPKNGCVPKTYMGSGTYCTASVIDDGWEMNY